MNIVDPLDDSMTEVEELRVACLAYRQEHGLTRHQMAPLVYSTNTGIWEFEMGLRSTNPRTIAAIKALVECSDRQVPGVIKEMSA